MKRYLLYLLLSSTGIINLKAQASFHILDWKASTTLNNYLVQQLHSQYESRDSSLDQALRKNSLNDYQHQCRERYLSILGPLPHRKCPLNPLISGTIQRKNYRIEKVSFESFPNHHVTANLYIPAGKGPFPGVLFFCGHEATAKATPTYQQTAILFAQDGFVVLSIDPVSQGERYQLTDPSGRPLIRGGTSGHTLLGAGSNLLGSSVVAYQLWDNERGLDYLCSRKEVDTARLGCLGNSGGGTQTAYFLPFDARIKVAAVCSYVTRRERSLELLGPQDGCQWIPGESEAGLDISDYLIMFAPRPVLILAGRYGFVDFNGTRDVARELSRVYAHMHQSNKISLFAYDNGHGIQKPKQQAAVQWFRRWFYQDNASVHEGALSTLSEKELNVTQTGQVNTSFKGEVTIQAMNLSLADQWRVKRHAALKELPPERYQRMIKKTLGISDYPRSVDTQQMGSFTQTGFQFQKIILRRSGQPPLPCLLGLLPENRQKGKLMVILDAEGKNKAMEDDSLLSAYAAAGYTLILADLRGMGETADDAVFNDHKYYNKEYRNAMLSLFTGQPLPGQRVEDIFTLLDFWSGPHPLNHSEVDIRATGAAAEATLLAAALDPRIDKIQLSQTITSFYALLHHPLMKDQYSYVIPAVMRYFDLPDLVTFIGKDKIQYDK